MTGTDSPASHTHIYLGASHASAERRTWAVIWLCTAMMAAEIVGGLLFGSIALVADGLHMSTHAGALLLAALAYRYARKHAEDPRFSFGTGKLGDLAGFASAIILAMIALLILYEALLRLLHPQPIQFAQAIPIAALGLGVNLASALLLSGGHDHGHGHHHGHDHHDDDDHDDHDHDDHDHHHDKAHRDNNLRAAIVHVAADAAVSVLVILGLLAARAFGFLWMDPLVGVIGALVIGSWSLSLIRDTGAILLDMTPDPALATRLRETIESEGDQLTDFHLWRLGPGHLGAILAIRSAQPRSAHHYRASLARFPTLSHVTIEIHEDTE